MELANVGKRTLSTRGRPPSASRHAEARSDIHFNGAGELAAYISFINRRSRRTTKELRHVQYFSKNRYRNAAGLRAASRLVRPDGG
jgi:hypothetical protein